MTNNILPLYIDPSQASSSQNSNVESYLQYCEVDSLKPTKSELSLLFGAMLLLLVEIRGFLLKTTLYACTVQYLMGSSMKPQNCSTQPTQKTFLILKAQKD